MPHISNIVNNGIAAFKIREFVRENISFSPNLTPVIMRLINKSEKLGLACLASALLLWAGMIVLGTRILLNYENSPGQAAVAPQQWPLDSNVPRKAGTFTLVLLAHPNCPCTRASLAVLEIIMTQVQGKLDALVLFSGPGASAYEIEAADLWKRAETIPGVRALYDRNGRETKLFGAVVSGQTMLYDPDGRLAFSGGITSSRGHQGSNYGMDAVIRRVRGVSTVLIHTPVFGCSLHDPSADALKEESWVKR